MNRKKEVEAAEPTQVVALQQAQEKAIKRISIADFLKMAKEDRPIILKEELVELSLGEDTILTVRVKQLTKSQTDSLSQRVIHSMPKVPTIDQVYSQAHKDPLSGKVRPAGSYAEPNPQDPTYLRETELWFNECAVWMGIYSAHEDIGVDPEADDANYQFSKLSEEYPPQMLMSISVAAARVNRGLHIAEELLSQLQRQQLEQSARAELMREMGLNPDGSQNS